MTQTALETIQGVMTSIAPVPVGIDPARLVLWEQRGKFSYEYVRSVIGASAQGLNEERAIAWADILALTTESAIWYMNGGAVDQVQKTMGRARPKQHRGFNVGHSIDLAVWSDSFGGDIRDLADMTESQLIGSVVGLITGFRDRFDYSILTRALSSAENALGTSGYDVGWCDGSPGGGTTGPKYAPPKYNGTVFYEDHNHYNGYNSSAAKTLADCLEGAALKVAEHGLPINTDFKVYVSETDISTYRGLSNYVMPVDNVREDRGGATSGNIFFEEGSVGPIPNSGGRYVGTYNTAYGFGQLFAIPRIPTMYGFLYRPGSAFAANNALALRYRDDFGYGYGLRIIEVPNFETTFPVKEVDLEDEYGISCGKNRYAGAAYYLVAGGTWADASVNL
jgi:hypothetical protein